MPEEYSSVNISEIHTSWTIIHDAQAPEAPEVRRMAQEAFFYRYEGPIRRYIRAAVRDDHVARELSSTFFERFVGGRFHAANPARGRFRDYLRRALFNLVADYRRKQKRAPGPLNGDVADPPSTEHDVGADEALFLKFYREGLLQGAWQRLEDQEARTGSPLATVLRASMAEPPMPAREIARVLSERRGKPVTEDRVRKLRMQARDAFMGYVHDQVRDSLHHPSRDRVIDELIDLGLYRYMRNFLHRKNAPA